MGISISSHEPESGGTGAPNLKFNKPGSSIVLGLVDCRAYQQTDLKTGEGLLWKDGNPRMGEQVIGIVLSIEGDLDVKTGTTDAGVAIRETPEIGSLVSVYAERGKHFTWRDAKEDLGRDVEVGDKLWWAFIEEKAPSNPAYNPQKVYEAKLAPATAEDGDLASRCMEKYNELQDKTTISSPEEPAPAAPAATASPF